jgi:hypothetical protein
MTAGRRVGPYYLVERLGRGGMGEVWLAEDPTGASGGAPRRVALKLLDPARVDDPGARARFAREVQAARRVTGPTIAALLDADVDADQPWLAAAYVAGPTLAEHVDAHGALAEGSLRALGAALAQALVSIHAAGVVHRDLTPRNVVLGPDGPRVVDFGIAWYDGATAITETGARIGTPAWMAPERLTHDEVTAAGDVWSWGAVMAYAALGYPAVGGGGPEVVAHRILRGEVDLADVPPWLAPWVTATMSVAPGERPPAAHLAAAMAGAALPPPGRSPAPPGRDPATGEGGGGAPGLGSSPTVPAHEGPPPTEPTHDGLPPTEASPGPGVGAPLEPTPADPPAAAAERRRQATPPDPTRAGEAEPPDRDGWRPWPPSSRSVARALSAAVVLAGAVAVGLWANLLVVVLVSAVALLLAVALRLSRLRLPEGARPVPPTWSVVLGGLVALGTGLAVALGPIGGAVAFVVLVVVFVVLGGDIT